MRVPIGASEFLVAAVLPSVPRARSPCTLATPAGTLVRRVPHAVWKRHLQLSPVVSPSLSGDVKNSRGEALYEAPPPPRAAAPAGVRRARARPRPAGRRAAGCRPRRPCGLTTASSGVGARPHAWRLARVPDGCLDRLAGAEDLARLVAVRIPPGRPSRRGRPAAPRTGSPCSSHQHQRPDVVGLLKPRFLGRESTGLIDAVGGVVILPRHAGAGAGGFAPAD